MRDRQLEFKLARGLEAIQALQRVILAGDSPGVKMAAGYALELLIGQGINVRPLPCRSNLSISYSVSVTILSNDMGRVLRKKTSRAHILPRITVSAEAPGRFVDAARKLACEVTGDESTEIVLWGRALSIEIWDDRDHELEIGFNFLAISRETCSLDDDKWEFEDFSQLDLNRIDPREALALSEMLSIMGIKNPYELAAVQDSDISAA